MKNLKNINTDPIDINNAAVKYLNFFKKTLNSMLVAKKIDRRTKDKPELTFFVHLQQYDYN